MIKKRNHLFFGSRSECPNRKKSIENGKKAGGDENDKKKKTGKAYVTVKDGVKHISF